MRSDWFGYSLSEQWVNHRHGGSEDMSTCTNELLEDGETLVEGWVFLHKVTDDAMDTLLDHHIDQVFLVRLKDDSEEKKTGGLLVGH